MNHYFTKGAYWKSKSEYVLNPTAKRFEFWESNYAAQIGLGTACDYAMSIGLGAIEARINELADKLRARLSETRLDFDFVDIQISFKKK